MNLRNSKKLYEKSCENLVGGVNSPVRAFKLVGGNPLFIDKAKGAYIKDVDGNRYVDLVLSYGPMILGHRHRKVEKAIIRAMKKGYSFGASTHSEIKLAKIICEAIPSIDKIRFVNSGTEAVLSAIRLARSHTGRDKIIKFSGCYHGHADSMLVESGSGLATLSLPSSKGIIEEVVKKTLVANYNDLESVKYHFERHPGEIAAVILEPVVGNMGVVKPHSDFLIGLRKLTKDENTLMICDEVMTGFRSNFGGAQQILELNPDITCLGKVIGGGFPVGAYGASNEIMAHVSPLGGMYQAGTLSGNPITMASGISTLTILKKMNPYNALNTVAERLENFLLTTSRKYKINLTVNRFGSMINPFFTSREVQNFEDAQTSNTDNFAKFFWGMLENGVFLPPSPFESWFLSTEIGERELEKIAWAIEKAMEKMSN